MSWDESDLGGYRGVGNERPRGPAEVKPGLDPGLAVVRFVFDAMRIDAEWSTRDTRGFVWWGHEHAQRVWADAGRDDHGVRIFRVFARTEVLRGVGDDGRAIEAIDRVDRTAATSALVLDPGARTVDLVASMWVHAGTVDWVSRLFSSVVALQAADAQAMAVDLASRTGSEPATSGHPVSGRRPRADDMLGVGHMVRAAGGAPSAWAGQGMVDALELVRSAPMTVMATGDPTGLSAEFPFGGSTCLVMAMTREAHPVLGHGMGLRVMLPAGGYDTTPGFAAELDRRELASMTGAHFLGGWTVVDGTMTHGAFYPNSMRLGGSDTLNLVMSASTRAAWAARELLADDWARPGRIEEARHAWAAARHLSVSRW